MSDENQEILPEGTAPETKAPEQTDPYVARALEMGWKPEDNWEGSPEDFIDAKEFVRRQPLFEKIEHQSKAIKQLNQAFEALKTHHTKVKEAEFQRALKTLKEARKEAMIEGETERALAYEQKIEEVEQQKNDFDEDVKTVEIPKTPEAHPEFLAWQKQNSWYGRDTELREFADTYGITLARKGMQPAEVLEAVAKKVKQAFPEKFHNPNRDKPGAVEAPTRRAASTDKVNMSDEDRQIMKTILRSGVMTEAEYLKQYKLIQGQ